MNKQPPYPAIDELVDYVAELIDWHQGYTTNAPHADLEQLGAAVEHWRRYRATQEPTDA